MAETFLKRVFGKVFAGRAASSQVILGAFGKHPGYPEHFEDLDAQAILTRLREQLYTHGVQAAVDAGVWKELDDQGKALPFRHTLVWRTGGSGGGSIVVGRMLASRDKLGRDKYPIMVVAVCPGDALEFALQQVLPWVQSVVQDCVAAATLPEVKAVIARARECSPPASERATEAASDSSTDHDRAMAFLVRCPELGDSAKGLVNILYQVDREMGAFVPASTSTSGNWTKTVSRRSAHIRVPRCGKSTPEAVVAWFRLLNGILAESAPVLLMIPDEEPGVPAWVDIVVGTPSEAEFFYLRSSTQTTPCTSDIPYTIPPEFTANTLERFKAATDKFAAPVELLGVSTQASEGSSAAPPAKSAVKSTLTRGRMVAILLVSISLLVALIAWKVLPRLQHESVAGTGPPPPARSNATVDPIPFPTRPHIAPSVVVTPATLPVAVTPSVTDHHIAAPVDPPKPPPATGPSPAEIAQRQTYLDSLRNQKGPFTSAELNQVWCDHRDGFLAANPLASYAELKAGMDAVTAPLSLVDANEALRREPGSDWTASANQPWVAQLRSAIHALAASHRDAAIKVVAGSLSESHAADSPRAVVASGMQSTTELPPQAVHAIDAFASWEKDADRLGHEWIKADDQLSCGVAVDQAVDGAPAGRLSAADIEANWKPHPLMGEASVRDALAPVVDRIDKLLKLNSASRADLSSAASSADSPFEIRLAAWRSLGNAKQHWPANDAEWTIETASRDSLVTTVKARQPLFPVESWEIRQLDLLAKELSASGIDRWTRFANDLPTSPLDIDKHLATASAFADRAGIDRSQLPASLQYDFSVLALRNSLAALKSAPDEQKLRGAMSGFCDTVEPLKIDADHVAKVRAELTARPQAVGTKADGPALAGFQAQPVSADEISFTSPWAKPVALHFVRLNINDGISHYLCTTEMSVGLFISAVGEKGSWDELKTLVWQKRLSPCTWIWKDERMQISPTWLPSHAPGFDDYPPALVGTSGQSLNSKAGNDSVPTADQPIQSVSTKSAVYAAALLGCRLPTAGEWVAARKMDSPAPPSAPDNLRDHTWAIERDYLASPRPADTRSVLHDLSSDVFTQASKISDLFENSKTGGTDDGVLWFRKVGMQTAPGSARRFSDLVGNVAEYVTDQSIPAGEWPASAKSAAGARDFITHHAASLRVIGGSALSSPDLAVDQPMPIESSDMADRGFSDTGFRLAFSAAEVPFRDRALAAVELIQYLPAKPAVSQ